MSELVTVRVETPPIPAPKVNLDEVQANIDNLLERYSGRVYTPDQMSSAKKDRAEVNAWEKQLAAASKQLKEHYLSPVEETLDRISAMRNQIKAVSESIDKQVKAEEAAEKAEKRQALEGIYQEAAEELAELIPFERLLDSRWLNKTTALSTAGRELRKALERCREELQIIQDTCGEDAEGCTTEYLRELSLNAALREHQRREDARQRQSAANAAREAAEKVKASAPVIIPPSEEERQIRAEAAADARAGAFVTPEGRLDMELLQTFAQPELERRRYRFWVEFTAEDIQWFKQGAAERGFRYGSIR